MDVGNVVLEKKECVYDGCVSTWWELNSYESITPSGVYVNPTLLKRGTKTKLEELLEENGHCIGEEISKNKYKVNLNMKKYILRFEDGTTTRFQGDLNDAIEYAASLACKRGSCILDWSNSPCLHPANWDWYLHKSLYCSVV